MARRSWRQNGRAAVLSIRDAVKLLSHDRPEITAPPEASKPLAARGPTRAATAELMAPPTNKTRQAERRQRVIELAGRPPAAGGAWRLIAGDCREVLAAEPEASADLVFADPPFNIGFNYRLYKDDLPDTEYLAFSREWMKQVLRVLKPGGSFYLAIGDGYAADLCCIARRELGLTLRNWIIWHYTFGQQRQSKWVSSHTHILYFSNGPEPVIFNADAVLVASARQTTYFDKRASAEGKMPDDVLGAASGARCRLFPRRCGRVEDPARERHVQRTRGLAPLPNASGGPGQDRRGQQ